MDTTAIAPARSIGPVFAPGLHDEGERQRQAQTDRQELLGVERDVEHLPGRP